ncbi:MAG: DHH family phosphoesterase, partial [Hyphomicrobiales bacterium]|nr:DHH family phosphoesterase [Hyphomicrobiales bacterium]
MTDPFLGVARSHSGRTWRARLDGPGEARAQALEALNGLDPALARILASRGVTPETAANFLSPRLRDLMPDPSTLVDMDRAVARFVRAVTAGQAIAIFGDYDVDGACSAALIAEWLRALGAQARIHIPDRLTEGYGPNVPAIEALRAEGAELLICVDCGTSGFEALAAARRIGLDALVLDHHL